MIPRTPARPRNDLAQYDELAQRWWDGRGPLAMLHWIAQSRAGLIPPPRRPDAVLLDVACGGGLMAPYVAGLGYRHVGLDRTMSALHVAREHGVQPLCGDARWLPVGDATVDVVVAGECLEHVPDLRQAVAELCRVVRPGGTVVVDAIADTALARFVAVTVAERMPGGPPAGLHDPRLFVDRKQLVAECARHGVALRLWGLRPAVSGWVAWAAGWRDHAPMVRTRSTAVLFQGVGVKREETAR